METMRVWVVECEKPTDKTWFSRHVEVFHHAALKIAANVEREFAVKTRIRPATLTFDAGTEGKTND